MTQVTLTALSSRVPEHVTNPSPLQMLDRLVRDVSVPVERMREALPVVLEILRETKRSAFEAAFPAMSAALPIIEKQGKIARKTGKPLLYAKIEDILEEVRPVLQQHGFGVRWFNGKACRNSGGILRIRRLRVSSRVRSVRSCEWWCCWPRAWPSVRAIYRVWV
jgi:hypothetical protein